MLELDKSLEKEPKRDSPERILTPKTNQDSINAASKAKLQPMFQHSYETLDDDAKLFPAMIGKLSDHSRAMGETLSGISNNITPDSVKKAPIIKPSITYQNIK